MWHRLEIADNRETLGALELTSIARGYLAVDRMLKKAPVHLLEARPYCPGKFLVVVSGDVASVQAAMDAGVAEAGSSLFGSIFIPNLSPAVVDAVNRRATPQLQDTVGVLESFSAVNLLEAADAAWKAADIAIHSIDLLQGIGGKAFALFTGELTDVQAAMAAARGRIPADMYVEGQIISQVSPEMVPFLPGSW